MRRKTKKTKKAKENCCQIPGMQGSAKMSTILAAVVIFVVFFGGTLLVVGKAFHWKQEWKGEKFGKVGEEEMIIRLQTQVSALQKQVSDLKRENLASPTPANQNQVPTKNQTTSAVFEKAVNDKDIAGIEALMAARVYYVIDQSDCCGDITKKEAAANLKNYISSAKSFNFDQNQQVVKQMKVNLPDTFAKYTIGIADNKMVLSYHLDKQGRVDDLMLSASHLMYDLE
ncbi:MAG: hypothetical protein PHP25_03335 [Candidatus Moranbacteria bacterium]|nr:hypothetical protein [Candidatus Moranbacteria bacterium]